MAIPIRNCVRLEAGNSPCLIIKFCFFFLDLVSHLNISHFGYEQAKYNDAKCRLYSAVACRRLGVMGTSQSLAFGDCLASGKRYESTAAASDASSSPPVQKYEYQAEVCL